MEELVGLGLVVSLLSGCGNLEFVSGLQGAGQTTSTVSSVQEAGAGQAEVSAEGIDFQASPQLQALATLAVRADQESAPEYSRDAFGQAWSDDTQAEFGHNGCDTRNDILRRDLTGVTFKPGTRDCVVTAGHLVDAYSGTELDFVRGQGTSELVQIDHIVPLADAWYSGAYTWDGETRQQIANDPRNLQATTKEENQAKKAKTADRWMPTDVNYHCTYAARIVEVKSVYGLSVTASERMALATTLAGCA